MTQRVGRHRPTPPAKHLILLLSHSKFARPSTDATYRQCLFTLFDIKNGVAIGGCPEMRTRRALPNPSEGIAAWRRRHSLIAGD